MSAELRQILIHSDINRKDDLEMDMAGSQRIKAIFVPNLYEQLDSSLKYYFILTGLNFPFVRSQNDRFNKFFGYLFGIIVILFGFALYIVSGVIAITTNQRLAILLFYVVFMIQSVGLGATIYVNTERLTKPVEKMEFDFYPEALKATYYTIFIFMVLSLPEFYESFVLQRTTAFAFVIIGIVSQNLLYSTNAFFVFVDTKIYFNLLNIAIMEQRNGKLTVELLDEIRSKIYERSQSAYISNNAMIFVGVINLLFIAGSFITSTWIFTDGYFLASILATMFRELFYCILVSWEIARVNELSDSLLTEIGKCPFPSSLTIKKDDADVLYNYCQGEFQKMSLVMNALTNPIHIKIIGLKLRRIDIIGRFILWFISILIGISIQQF